MSDTGADELVVEDDLRSVSMASILLVEDDVRISEPLVRVLRSEDFDVIHVAAGNAALEAIVQSVPSLVLLDLTLPDLDGLDVCRKIRADHADLPIIMLTARSEEVDVIVGLNAGADDYVAKPFRLAELIARIRARLRVAETKTAAAATTPKVLTGADLVLDLEARRCYRTTDHTRVEIDLTTKEFDLLALLMGQPGVTLHRPDIMSAVWDEHWWGSTRTLDTHTSTLRRKIADNTDPPTKIVTVRGVGFRFEP